MMICRWDETTAATNGPIVHPPGDAEPWWIGIDRIKLPILTPELSGSPTSIHQVANQDELGEGNEEYSL
jgi:hypothetical protein